MSEVNLKDKALTLARANIPLHTRSDVNPVLAGKSLLHTKEGMPIVKSYPEKAPVKSEVKEERVFIQANSQPSELISSNKPLSSRGLNAGQTATAPTQDITIVNPGQEPLIIKDPEMQKRILAAFGHEAVNLPVHVGMGYEDRVWSDGVNQLDKFGEPLVNVDALQSSNSNESYLKESLLKEAVSEFEETLDEVFPVKLPETDNSSDDSDDITVNDEPSFLSLQQNEYCILVDGETVCVSSDFDLISACVEELAVDYQISLNSIHVLKRLSVSFGIKMA